MSLREEMWKYEQITGESAEHVPIIKLGAFLDGCEKGYDAGYKRGYKTGFSNGCIEGYSDAMEGV